MAMLRAEQLEDWGSSSDQDVPVGGFPVRVAATARRVRKTRASNGLEVLVFDNEVPIEICREWRRLSADPNHGFYRYEVKIKHAPDINVNTGDHVVIAQFPYGNGLLRSAPFRAPEKAGPDYSSLSVAWQKGKYLTAAAEEGPNPALILRDKLRDEWKGDLFGVCCGDFRDFQQTLMNELRARSLLDEAQKQELHVKVPAGFSGAHAPRDSRRHAYDKAKYLLTVAASQALAGPSELSVDYNADKDRWNSRPVMDLVEQIYRDHLYAFSSSYEPEDAYSTYR